MRLDSDPLRLREQTADLAQSVKVVDVLGKGRHGRHRDALVSRGEPLGEMALPSGYLLSLRVEPQQGSGEAVNIFALLESLG